MERYLGLLLGLMLLMPGAVAAQAATDEDDGAVTKTRFGSLSVVDDESEPYVRRLLLDGGEILRYEGDALGVDAVYSAGSRDLALVRKSSGGIGCPFMFAIVQLEAKKAPLLSDEFGTCSDIAASRLKKGVLVVEMPVYVAHPDEWDEKDLKEAERSKVVFTWTNGKLADKTVKK